MLTVSVLCALLLYGFVFAAAPSILILQANSEAHRVEEFFKVDLTETMEPIRYENPDAKIEADAPRPSSVAELLEDELRDLAELEPATDEPSELPNLAERVGSERIDRDHDVSRDERVVEQVDAKILEISRNAARKNIKVARRLVRPSPENVLEPGALPTFRGEGGLFGEPGASGTTLPDTLDRSRPIVLAEAIAEEEGFERPAFEEGVLTAKEEDSSAPMLRALEIEEIVARLPLREAVREQSHYESLDDFLRIDLATYSATPGQGFFRLRIVPKDIDAMDVMSKDVSFVVDASKSILQRKLQLTARGVARCVAMLRPGDRFNIIVFRDSSSLFSEEWTEVTPESKQAAIDFLEGLKSRGETDVYSAVLPVIKNSPREGRPEVLMVMSDGRPTSGFLQGRDVINALTETNVHRKAVYAFGAGKTVNRYLLDLLAYRNKGESMIARDYNLVAESLPLFFERLSDPILLDLRADYGSIDTEDVYPKEIPDFYNGRVVEIFGKFDPEKDKEFVVRIQGVAGTDEKELLFKAAFDKAAIGDDEIARQWAFQKAYYLIGEICRVGERADLVDELRSLSRIYNVRTSYSP